MGQRNQGREWRLEEEKAALIERHERLMMGNQHLWKEAKVGIFEQEKEIMTLKKDLEESRAKNLEQKKKIVELEKGMKFLWPVATLAGTAVAAVMIFLSYAKQKKH